MKSFETIIKKLEEANFPFEEITFTDNAVSARISDTSLNGNYNPHTAIKTLVVKNKQEMFAVIVRGDSSIDKYKLKDIIGKWTVVSSEILLEKLGYRAGCVCPLDIDIPVFVDKKALELETWSMGAGASDKGINAKSTDVLNYLSQIQICDIT